MWTIFWVAGGIGALAGLVYGLVRYIFPVLFVDIPRLIWLFITKGIPDIIEGAREGWRQGRVNKL